MFDSLISGSRRQGHVDDAGERWIRWLLVAAFLFLLIRRLPAGAPTAR